MNRLILAAALLAGGSLASAIPADAATRNYDCSKAGNANKAACKTGAKAASAAKVAAASAKANAAAEKKQAAANAKAAKAAGAKPATKTASAAPAPAKPGLMDRMKGMFGGKTAAPAPAAKPAARRTASASNAAVEDHNPAGAIAQCKDGTYSHAKARTGACSRHGGVGKWS